MRAPRPRRRCQRRALGAVGAVALLYLAAFAHALLVDGAWPLSPSEIAAVLPMVAASLLAPPHRRHACAPCGCADAPHALCMRDGELARLAAEGARHRARLASPRAGVAVAGAARALGLRLDARACASAIERVDEVAAAAAASATSAAPGPLPRTRLWHWYWRPRGGAAMGPPHAAILVSFLATQSNASVLVVWVPVPHAPPPLLLALAASFPGRLFTRALDAAAEAAGGPLAGSFLLAAADDLAWADSDIARLAILWRYGGVYFDTDVLLLRDAAPLLDAEFATEFSCDAVQCGGAAVCLNNAVLHFFPRSPAITGLCAAARAQWPRLRAWTFGPDALRRAHGPAWWRALVGGEPPFSVLPWCFYHALWCKGGVPLGAREGAAEWDVDAAARGFGLHLHGATGGGGAARGSVVATFERKHHAVLAAEVGARGGGAGEAWARARGALVVGSLE